jgi:hypothetical protein
VAAKQTLGAPEHAEKYATAKAHLLHTTRHGHAGCQNDGPGLKSGQLWRVI